MVLIAIPFSFMFGSNCSWPNSSWVPLNCWQWKSRLLWHLALLHTAFFSTFWHPLRKVSAITLPDFHHQQLMCTWCLKSLFGVPNILCLALGVWNLAIKEWSECLKKRRKFKNSHANGLSFYSIFEDFTLIVCEKLASACWKMQLDANQCNFLWTLSVTAGKNRQAPSLGVLVPICQKVHLPFPTFWRCKMELMKWPPLAWHLLLHLLIKNVIWEWMTTRAAHLHWNRIGCIQERGGLGLCDGCFRWRLCLKWEGFVWYLLAFMAKAVQEQRQFPANCFSSDVQPPFPVSYVWWFCTARITLALKYQGIFVTRIVSHYWICKKHHLPYYLCHLWTPLCFLCRKGRFPFSVHLH